VEPGNATRVLTALTEFGAPLTGATAEDFANPDHVYQIGVGYVRIDVMMNVPGLTLPRPGNEETRWISRASRRLFSRKMILSPQNVRPGGPETAFN
jgi:hypothetical protein